MKKKLLLFIMLSIALMTSCKKKELFPELEIEHLAATVTLNNSMDIKILSGSGKYTALSMDEQIAKPVLNGNVLRIEGVALGSVTIKVTDTSSHQSVEISVTVIDDENVMVLIDSKVLEFKAIAPDKDVNNIPVEKVREYWGDRIDHNTPNELRFKNDSLYIIKPNNLIEKYKIEWRGEQLYLNAHGSTEWFYCGVRNLGKHQFALNTIFYKGVCKNNVRTLRFAKQSYDNIAQGDISDNYPSASVVWTKMNFIFRNK